MPFQYSDYPFIKCMNPGIEKVISESPFLNIDSLLIPSPYILDKTIDIDYFSHS